MFKTNIFIGSSKEGLKVAQKLKKQLEAIADVTLWTDAFELNSNTYEELASQIAFYDYAILVATADDTLRTRHKEFKTGRDNVLFEFGLFSGGLGKNRVFYMVEETTKLPSDLLGITLPFFKAKDNPEQEQSIIDCASQIQSYIKAKEQTFDLGFVPSTVLAVGYFKNFIERTVERLLEDKNTGKVFTLSDGSNFAIEDLKVSVLIPDDLSGNMFTKVKAKRLRDGWHKLKVDPKDVRDYDFSIDVQQAMKGVLHLVDIPFTLNALNEAIELYSKKKHIGKDQKEKVLEQRVIRNFKRTLEYLIEESSMTKGIVQVEVVPI